MTFSLRRVSLAISYAWGYRIHRWWAEEMLRHDLWQMVGARVADELKHTSDWISLCVSLSAHQSSSIGSWSGHYPLVIRVANLCIILWHSFSFIHAACPRSIPSQTIVVWNLEPSQKGIHAFIIWMLVFYSSLMTDLHVCQQVCWWEVLEHQFTRGKSSNLSIYL